jgi:hypothetical protein
VKHRSVITLLFAAQAALVKVLVHGPNLRLHRHRGRDRFRPPRGGLLAAVNGKWGTSAFACPCIGSETKKGLKCLRAIEGAYIEFASMNFNGSEKMPRRSC